MHMALVVIAANGNFMLSRQQQAIFSNYLSIFPSVKQKQAIDFVVENNTTIIVMQSVLFRHTVSSWECLFASCGIACVTDVFFLTWLKCDFDFQLS